MTEHACNYPKGLPNERVASSSLEGTENYLRIQAAPQKNLCPVHNTSQADLGRSS